MRTATKSFVGLVVALTVFAVAASYLARPTASRAEVAAIGFLSALAIVGELLAYVLSRQARGSIAFIPYLATVLIVPSWLAVVAVIVVKLLTEARANVAPVKATFN